MRKNLSRRGSTYIATTVVLSGLSIAGMTYMNISSRALQDAQRRSADAQLTQLCDAGVQSCLRTYWREFKQSQNFTALETLCAAASPTSPKGVQSGQVPGVGKFAAGVVAFSQPGTDTYTRQLTVRATGWIDSNGNGAIDSNEAVKIVDVRASFQLARSQIFDYTYFVNNYGWMSGFNESNLIVNGDMRANGDFALTNGIPTINGTVIATSNDKLASNAKGIITGSPVKWSNTNYGAAQGVGFADNEARWRQAYNESQHGAKGSAQYKQWQDILFDSEGSIQGDQLTGSVLMDSDGAESWQRESNSATPTHTLLDSAPSQEVVMPDLSDITHYQALSSSYVDNKGNHSDGSANPHSGQGAWVEIWNESTNSYQRISTNGVVSGSAVLVGTEQRPIRIHGPVTVTQDIVIKGTVSGQGTFYAGRNIHVVGSIRYKNKPDFRGSNPTAIDAQNEKADVMGLAARGSVIMGNPNTFTNTTLQYMQPPFTKGRYDQNGNWVPAYNGNEIDSTGRPRFKSVIPDETMDAIAEGINQIDAVVYTNFVGGGNLGTSGGGVTFNGSIISRDEAMVVWSLPMRMNYDTRIKERSLSRIPLIDIKLPRSPILLRSTWQERGVSYGS